MGLGSSGTCLLLLLDILSGPLISLVYPLFATVQAIESGSNNDLRPVLTYWVLYSLIALFELVFASVLVWIPIWGVVKTVVNCFLVLPSFNGSTFVYQQFLKSLVSDPQLSMNLSNSSGLKDILNELSRILTTGLNYIKNNIGPQVMGGGGGGGGGGGTNNGSNFVSNFEDGSTYNGFRGGRSTYNGYDNRSNSHIYDDRSSSSRRVRGYNYDD